MLVPSSNRLKETSSCDFSVGHSYMEDDLWLNEALLPPPNPATLLK